MFHFHCRQHACRLRDVALASGAGPWATGKLLWKSLMGAAGGRFMSTGVNIVFNVPRQSGPLSSFAKFCRPDLLLPRLFSACRTRVAGVKKTLPTQWKYKSAGECPLEETDPVAILTQGNTNFFTAEIEIMKALFSGKGIEHHMEQNCKWAFILLGCLHARIFRPARYRQRQAHKRHAWVYWLAWKKQRRLVHAPFARLC